MSEWMGWAELVAEQLLLVVALLVVFEGCRRLVRNGFSRGPALAVAVALVLPVWDGSNNLKVIREVQLLQAKKLAALYVNAREPAGGWEKSTLSPSDRTAASTLVAVMNYKFLGKRTELLDEQGHRVLFDPTPQQTQDREQVMRDEKGAEDAAEAAYERGIRLFIEIAGFIVAGLLTGLRQRARA